LYEIEKKLSACFDWVRPLTFSRSRGSLELAPFGGKFPVDGSATVSRHRKAEYSNAEEIYNCKLL